MIDRIARNKVAEAARHYVSGNSTNFALDDAVFALKSNDPAIEATRRQLWLIYDDLREHRDRGEWKLSSQQHNVVVRIIAFLKSDFEYQWPVLPSWYSIIRPVIAVLTFGYASTNLDRRFAFQDAENTWPFTNHEEIKLARQQPKYLASAT